MKNQKTPQAKSAGNPAHISEVRRAAAMASAKARAARSPNKGRRPKAVHIRADVYDDLSGYAAEQNATLTDTATEIIKDGLANIRRNPPRS